MLENSGAYNYPRLWRLLRAPLDRLGLLYSAHGAGQLLSADDTRETAYPGATALALAAGLVYRQATGDHQFDDWFRQWVHGLLAMHLPGRGFREAPHQLGESDYVNGEAWLALAMYAEAHPKDTKIAGLLATLDEYMLERYYGSSSRQFYHWGSMASAKRAGMSRDESFDDFLASLTRRFIAKNAPPTIPAW